MVELTLTTGAYYEICELSGCTGKLKEWLVAENPTDRLKQIISIMAEATQKKKGQPVTDVDFPTLFTAAEIIGTYLAISGEIDQAMYHEIPPKVKTTAPETDDDLDYVLQLRADKKGLKRPNKALSTIARGLSCGLDYDSVLNRFTPGEIMQIWLYQLEMKGGNNG